MITATVIGNLGQEPTTKQVGGSTVVEFSVASSTKKGGEERTTWIRAAYWGKPAEAVVQYLSKGKKVAISGSIEMREFESKGEKRSSLEMRVDHLQLLGDATGSATKPANGARPAASSIASEDSDIPF